LCSVLVGILWNTSVEGAKLVHVCAKLMAESWFVSLLGIFITFDWHEWLELGNVLSKEFFKVIV